MNHELILLREVKRVRKLSQSLAKEAKYKAVKSHLTYNVKNGTLGQVEEINQLIQLRDDCLLFCLAVNDAMALMDDDKRWLLKQFYLKRAQVGALADRFKVSRTKVYNKLFAARTQFRNILIKLGYDEQWLRDCYGHFDFIAIHFDE